MAAVVKVKNCATLNQGYAWIVKNQRKYDKGLRVTVDLVKGGFAVYYYE